MNRTGKGLLVLSMTGLGLLASAEEPIVSSSVEQFIVSGRRFGPNATRDRFTRATIGAEWGHWNAQLSYWYYPFCGWREVDESTLAYSVDGFSAKAGRFRVPIGQANWDDQWYSGFVFIPSIEFEAYGGRRFLERTSVGFQVEKNFGDTSVKVALVDANARENRLTARKHDRLAMKVETYQSGVIFAVSGMVNTDGFGDDEQILALDARYTLPQWVFRGEVISYLSDTQASHGYVVDTYDRPSGSDWITGVFRWDHITRSKPTTNRYTLYTAGAKIRLPGEINLNANYGFGPGINQAALGGNWAFSLNKTFKF